MTAPALTLPGWEQHHGLHVAELEDGEVVAVGTDNRQQAARAINAYLSPRSDWTVTPGDLNRGHVLVESIGGEWEVALAHPHEDGALPAVLLM